MLDQITPLILTRNEAPNVARALKSVSWARDIVVVDSFSDDQTIEIARSFPQVRVFQRTFDSHSNQWEFGLTETGISTPWVLALDADYVVPAALRDELRNLQPDPATCGYRASFIYCINGKKLRSGIYPSVTVLYRREAATYIQDGHAQRVVVEGEIANLHASILHDDRKSLRHWFASQQRYAALEAQKLLSAETESLDLTDRLRRWYVVMPPAMLVYCLFVRGGIFDGWAGFHYALQRTVAELILSRQLIDRSFTFNRVHSWHQRLSRRRGSSHY